MTSTATPSPSPSAEATEVPAVERIASGSFSAEIVPAIGGSLVAFYSSSGEPADRRDWLRPADTAALRGGSPLDMASFPLVPWCNRIRNGAFEWNGRRVELGPNRPDSPHAIHGIGWQRPWAVAGRGDDWIELVFDEPGHGAWPYPFEARQRYALAADGLSIHLSLRNTGNGAMPAGIGHHPYFPKRSEGAGTTVQARVDAMWLTDREVMPTALSATDPAVAALRQGMPLARFDLDNNFTGFDHHARVAWPDGSSLVLQGDPPLDHFVLYCPNDKDFFVMEAVSNCTDWINLRDRFPAADLGGTALPPGETLVARIRFLPTVP